MKKLQKILLWERHVERRLGMIRKVKQVCNYLKEYLYNLFSEEMEQETEEDTILKEIQELLNDS